MSDTFDTELETGSAAGDTTSEDRLASVMRDAKAAFVDTEVSDGVESAEESEAVEVDDDPADAEVEEPAGDPDDEVEPESDEDAEPADEADFSYDTWDGQRDSLPEGHRKVFDTLEARMTAGAQKWMQKRDAAYKQKEAELDSLVSQYRQALVNPQQAQGGQQPSGGRPEAPGPDATAADWQAYEDALSEYTENRILNRLTSEGRLVDPNERAAAQQQAEVDRRVQWIRSQPDFNDAVGQEIARLVQMPQYASAAESDFGAQAIYELAVKNVKLSQVESKNAESVVAETKRKAGAAKRATPRPGSAKAKAPSVSKNLSKARNVDEKLNAFKADFLAEVRND